MRDFVLMTDSCCDLPAQLAEELGLVVLPLHLLGGILTRPKPHSPTHTAGKHPTRR